MPMSTNLATTTGAPMNLFLRQRLSCWSYGVSRLSGTMPAYTEANAGCVLTVDEHLSDF